MTDVDPVFVRIEEIARVYGWSVGYARVRASREKWRRQGWGPRLYSLADASYGVSLLHERPEA